jgi:hypothetical protein
MRRQGVRHLIAAAGGLCGDLIARDATKRPPYQQIINRIVGTLRVRGVTTRMIRVVTSLCTRSMHKACAFVLLVTALAMPARAADRVDTGNDYMRKCGTISPTHDVSSAAMGIYCVSYALGVADGLTLAHMVSPQMIRVCIPDAVTPDQVRLVAISYMRKHPENLHDSLAFLMADAFTDAWPCR